MLRELEEEIVKIIDAALVELPKGGIVLGPKPPKVPGLAISNAGFEFESPGLAEELGQPKLGKVEMFSGNGSQTSFKLKEKPLSKTVRVQYPPGTALVEGKEFTADYGEGTLAFRAAPKKDKNNILVEYMPRSAVITLKTLKLKATYLIDVWGPARADADALAEKVVKALLSAQGDLATRGIELKLVAGGVDEEEAKATKIRLRYALERELRLETVVGLIEKVEISSKNIP